MFAFRPDWLDPQPARRPPSRSKVRPRLEELECRASPTGTGGTDIFLFNSSVPGNPNATYSHTPNLFGFADNGGDEVSITDLTTGTYLFDTQADPFLAGWSMGAGDWASQGLSLSLGTHTLEVMDLSTFSTADLTVTVLPPPVTDVTSSLSVTVKHEGAKALVTVTNTSGQAIPGPVYLVVEGLGKKFKLRNATGTTHQGLPYVTGSQTQLAPGASLSFTLSFKGGKGAHFTPHVLAGSGPI